MLKVERWLNQKTCAVAEGDTHIDLFKNLAGLQEVFGEEKCGKCKGDNLRFYVRTVPDGKKVYEYFELSCMNPDCRARLTFGQKMEGGELFPKRFDMEGEVKKWKPDYGWVTYVPEKKEG